MYNGLNNKLRNMASSAFNRSVSYSATNHVTNRKINNELNNKLENIASNSFDKSRSQHPTEHVNSVKTNPGVENKHHGVENKHPGIEKKNIENNVKKMKINYGDNEKNYSTYNINMYKIISIGMGVLIIIFSIIFISHISKVHTSLKIYELGKDITTISANGYRINDHHFNILFRGTNNGNTYFADFSGLKPPTADPIHIFYDIGIDNDDDDDNNTHLTLFFGHNQLTVGSGFHSKLTFDNSGLSVSLSYIDGKWRAINLGATVDEVEVG